MKMIIYILMANLFFLSQPMLVEIHFFIVRPIFYLFIFSFHSFPFPFLGSSLFLSFFLSASSSCAPKTITIKRLGATAARIYHNFSLFSAETQQFSAHLSRLFFSSLSLSLPARFSSFPFQLADRFFPLLLTPRNKKFSSVLEIYIFFCLSRRITRAREREPTIKLS